MNHTIIAKITSKITKIKIFAANILKSRQQERTETILLISNTLVRFTSATQGTTGSKRRARVWKLRTLRATTARGMKMIQGRVEITMFEINLMTITTVANVVVVMFNQLTLKETTISLHPYHSCTGISTPRNILSTISLMTSNA